MSKYSPWYPHEIKPVREGIYNVWAIPSDRDRWYSYWDGKRFNWMSTEAHYAHEQRAVEGAGYTIKKWRGLARKPK